MKELAVVIPCRDDERVGSTVDSLLQSIDQKHIEIVVVDDGSTNGCCQGLPQNVRVLTTDGVGVSRAKNLGADVAVGHWVAFCDAHMTFEPGWTSILCQALNEQPEGGMAVPTVTPLDGEATGCGMAFMPPEPVPQFQCQWVNPSDVEPVPLGPGMCQLWERTAFEKIGRFAQTMGPWGGEDLEICIRARVLGYDVVGVPLARVAHAFRTSFAPDFDTRIAVANDLQTAFMHFSPHRLTTVLAELAARWSPEDLSRIWAIAATPEVFAMREWIDAHRIMSDDEWFRDVQRWYVDQGDVDDDAG